MREEIHCRQMQLNKTSDDNQRLINELIQMKTQYERVDEENQHLKIQLQNEQIRVSRATRYC
jgi:FtsZ-binding cell division protein ZapB